MTNEIRNADWQPLANPEIRRLMESLAEARGGRPAPEADRLAVWTWAIDIRAGQRDLEMVLAGELVVDVRDGKVALLARGKDGRLITYGLHRDHCSTCGCSAEKLAERRARAGLSKPDSDAPPIAAEGRHRARPDAMHVEKEQS